jgi:P-type Cu+ transporter
MNVETAAAVTRSDYKGVTYYFCCSGCKNKFDQAPEQYLNEPLGAPKSGKGCCNG